ncbi:hypothetical protein HAX54_039880 [Datura stramonium]|uniref:Uncharacterized protein n=1 Tax=Datura stramonium TaxID=4076 RepID=A0ABS8VQL7_DATST|nr:hypothetical protein [Datura stramonium]
MLSLQNVYTTVRSPPCPLFSHPRRRQCSHFRSRRNCANNSVYPPRANVKLGISNLNRPEQTPRTLFPGGYKRPEIKVPSLVLKLSCEDVLRDEAVVNEIDQAISGRVDVVVLSGDGASGGKLYEAARLLKSVIKGRAYLLIDERVDIAAAVSASGVLLSDQDLPAIVARNTMMDSKSEESVVLPLVARIVQTPTAAVAASNSEGADFLIYEVGGNSEPEELVSSVFEQVKIPVFVTIGSLGDRKLFNEASNLLESGASGIVISLEDLRSVSDDDFGKLFYSAYALKKKTEEKSQSNSQLKVSDLGNGFPSRKGVAGFIDLRDREKQLLEKERLILRETVNVIEKAAPMMEEISLLKDAVSQLDEPFLLVIVGEFNSGKSTFINALLGKKHPDGQYVCYLPASVLEEMIIVDTPGTNVILQRQQRLLEEFVPRADLLLFVMSADRPLTESEILLITGIYSEYSYYDCFGYEKNFCHDTGYWRGQRNCKSNIACITLFRNRMTTKVRGFLKCIKFFSTPPKLSYFSSYGPQSARGATFHALLLPIIKVQLNVVSFSVPDITCAIPNHFRIPTTGKAIWLVFSLPQQWSKKIRVCAEQVLTYTQIRRVSARLALESKLSTFDGALCQSNGSSNNDSHWSTKNSMSLRKSALQLSNVDLGHASYVFRGEKSTQMPATTSVQNEILGPAVLEGQNLLGEYTKWLQSKRDQEVQFYKQSFEKRWTSLVNPSDQIALGTTGVLERKPEVSIRVIEDFSAAAASKLFERYSWFVKRPLTSVLPTTLEDLLALGLCSAGGLIAVSNFSSRRQQVVDKVKRTADGLARELEDAMQKDLLETTRNVEDFVKLIVEAISRWRKTDWINFWRLQEN